ncbi:uncharacterized protein LOC131254363 [Magnolia sinica]|uniref:uncharacterized protein LOC131254363 n=1 Tax=Magnolia sinica TaxID=86752 RepID=UPI00265B7135|nr:uncharacterized protein LOC131254363 [Magnolia sinica]
MDSLLIWNSRGLANAATIRSALRLVRAHNPSIVAILERIARDSRRVGIGLKLGFHSSFSNDGVRGKIWILYRGPLSVSVIENSNKTISLDVYSQDHWVRCRVTIVYTKCSRFARRTLWNTLESLASSSNGPWAVGGDFNAVVDSSERMGYRDFDLLSATKFKDAIDKADLLDVGFGGNRFTWCNNHDDRTRM